MFDLTDTAPTGTLPRGMSKETAMDDKQVAAIQAVVKALSDLEEEDLRVVLGFINLRYGAAAPAHAALPRRGMGMPPGLGMGEAAAEHGQVAGQFGSFPELYHAAQPQTDSEKALVGGYWLQVSEGGESFDSLSVNQRLKDMGYPIGNITRAFDWLKSQKPQLVHQMKKGGSTRQARKLFKVTQAGIKRVEEMIQSNGQE